MASRVAVWGGPQECTDRLGEIIEAGADFLILNPVFDELEHLERIASDIAPRLGVPGRETRAAGGLLRQGPALPAALLGRTGPAEPTEKPETRGLPPRSPGSPRPRS